jgi:hypothetical protein
MVCDTSRNPGLALTSPRAALARLQAHLATFPEALFGMLNPMA